MNAVVALCHFCETHGPRVLFCCQPYADEVPVHLRPASGSASTIEDDNVSASSSEENGEFYGKYECFAACMRATQRAKEPTTSGRSKSLSPTCAPNVDLSNYLYCDTCDACRSMGTTFPGFLVSDDGNRISYVGSQFPYHPEVFTIVRHACLRSLSCEICPGREGPIFFGDSVCGYCLSYTFNLKDLVARGFQHLFSIVVVSMDKMILLNNYDFFVGSLASIVKYLQAKARAVFEEEQSRDQERLKRKAIISKSVFMHTTAFLRERQDKNTPSPRSLSELTGQPDIYKRLNRAFVWLLRAQNHLSVEVILEGLPDQDELTDLETRINECPLEDGHNDFSDPTGNGDATDASATSLETTRLSTMTTLNGVCLAHTAASLNRAMFRLLIYHLLIGNQTVVQSADESLAMWALSGLRMLLPKGCIRQVAYSFEYLECWRCNLLGLSDRVQLNTVAADSPHFLVTVTGLSSEGDDAGMPSSLEQFLKSSIGARPCGLGAPAEFPTLVDQITSTLYESDLSTKALSKLLLAVKQEWMNKAKLLYSIKKQYNESEASITCRWRLATRCKEADEVLVKFWQTGLSQNAKSCVMSACSGRS